MPLQFLILLVLSAAATIVSVLTSIAVVVRKTVDRSRARTRARLYRLYAEWCSELLLRDLPTDELKRKPSQVFKSYETLIEPIKRRHDLMSKARREVHRRVLRQVLVDVAQDITGESSDRLLYFFYSFGFVEEEIQLIQSRRWWVRAQAARSMGLLGARKGITALTAALEDPHPDVRNQAMQSLVKLVGPEALRTILRVSTRLSRWSTIELSVIVSRFKESAVPYLIEALSHRDQSVVLFSTEMLGEIGFVEAVMPLMNLVGSSKDTAIQAGALNALGRLGDERARTMVMEFLESERESVRMKAIEALGRIGGRRAPAALEPFLTDGGKEEGLAAARALASMGTRGVAVLQKVAFRKAGEAAAMIEQVLEEFNIGNSAP